MSQRNDPQSGDTSDNHFAESPERLESVTTTFRPGYGFAFYALGILHRVWEKWYEAHTYLQRALLVPDEYRDVSAEQVQEQLRRVAERDKSYPERFTNRCSRRAAVDEASRGYRRGTPTPLSRNWDASGRGSRSTGNCCKASSLG